MRNYNQLLNIIPNHSQNLLLWIILATNWMEGDSFSLWVEAYRSFYSGCCLQAPYRSNGLLFYTDRVCVCVCMYYVYLYTHVCKCVSVCMCASTTVWGCVYIYIRAPMCVCVFLCAHTLMWMYTHVCVSLFLTVFSEFLQKRFRRSWHRWVLEVGFYPQVL